MRASEKRSKGIFSLSSPSVQPKALTLQEIKTFRKPITHDARPRYMLLAAIVRGTGLLSVSPPKVDEQRQSCGCLKAYILVWLKKIF